jgi:tetratricopeptide (TPR) repeat protein
MMDVVLVAMQMQTEGDDLSGYRITITPPGAQKLILFVVKEDGVLRILDSAEKPNAIGLEVLDRLAVNNTAGARILLDWVRDAEHLAGGDDPLAGFAFPRMWTKGKEASAEQMKVAAAAILAQSPQTALDGIPILEANRATAASDPEKLNLAIALLSGYSSVDEYAKDLALASEVAKQYPESKSVFFSQQIALRGLGRFAEADQLAQEMTKRLPDDTDVMRAFIYTAVAHEDYSLAHELGRKMVTAGEAEAQDLNAVAWNALFTGFVQNEDLEDATKSAQLTQNSAGVLHTLGCVYAEMGKTKEAREVLIQAMDQMSLDEPDANYAFGRIAEQYGEYEIATSDYKQIKMPNKPVSVPGSAYRLAQNRLSAMRGADHAKAQ